MFAHLVSRRALRASGAALLLVLQFAAIGVYADRPAMPPGGPPSTPPAGDVTTHAPGSIVSSEVGLPTTYLIIAPHSRDECLTAMNEVAQMGPTELDDWFWGCRFGNHTGYRFTVAANETEALNSVPEFERDKAKAIPVETLTETQIRKLHQQPVK